MSTLALTTTRQQKQVRWRPQPLLSVVGWELRRFRSSRLFWIQALGFFALLLFVTWSERTATEFVLANPTTPFHGLVAGTSAWGLLVTLPPGPLLLLGLLLPFVNTDGATRDLSRRTHELFMTTPLPSWAYVWGRFLSGLLISLGLAVLLVTSLLGMGILLHLTIAGYPAPVVGNLLVLWIGMVLPATILLSGLSFALGVVFPQRAMLVKIVVLLAWFVVGVAIPPVGPGGNSSIPAWYIAWDPTSAATGQGLVLQYRPDFQSQAATATSAAQLQRILVTVENTLPGLRAWLAPHLLLAVFGLALVALAALSFNRFRNTFAA